MIGFALRHVGLAVCEAAAGEDAITFYRERHQDISAVLLDMVLPDGDGGAVLAALRAINPGVKCIFVTGDGAADTRERMRELEPAGVVIKPFAFTTLVEAVQTVLAR